MCLKSDEIDDILRLTSIALDRPLMLSSNETRLLPKCTGHADCQQPISALNLKATAEGIAYLTCMTVSTVPTSLVYTSPVSPSSNLVRSAA